jgi:hypothetical protein
MTITAPGLGVFDSTADYIAAFDYPDQAIPETARRGVPAIRALHEHRKGLIEQQRTDLEKLDGLR